MSDYQEILAGKVQIFGTILTQTGLHIGAGLSEIEKGRVGNLIIRDKLTDQPYIPGSALRGKLRFILEVRLGKKQNWSIRREIDEDTGEVKYFVWIHVCIDHDDPNATPTYFKDEDFKGEICPVCRIFGLPAEANRGHSTRLYVDDCQLKTPLPDEQIERKWEAAIDRITSAAVPRQIERVPRKHRFSLALSYDIYQQPDGSLITEDIDRLFDLFSAMAELEDYYIGGSGSRGYGSIAFQNLDVRWKPRSWYEAETPAKPEPINGEHRTPMEIVKNFRDDIHPKLMGA